MSKALIVALLAILAVSPHIAFATAAVGKAAPDFTLTELGGKPVRLADFKGRHVVLEWHNPHCPFVAKHYDSGNMPGLQSKYDAKDTVWLSVNSTHPGHQDFMSSDKLKGYLADKGATPDAYLIDANGAVGMAYGARTTPHMYVINPAGLLVYAGAIDDKRSTQLEDAKSAKNYLVAALEESKGGKPVSMASTQPYGCSVKYR
ncbi:MAG: thioredoxin family protein [Betaproteobacteria bacterium]